SATSVMSVPFLWVNVEYDHQNTSSVMIQPTLSDRVAAIAKSQYDVAARMQGRTPSPAIEQGRCIMVARQPLRNYNYDVLDIHVAGSTLKPLKQTVLPVIGQSQAGSMMVVSDATYAELLRKDVGQQQTVQGYMVSHPEQAQAVSVSLENIIPEKAHFSSYVQLSDAWFGQFGIIAFIGLFLGLVFVFATGSIITYKQLMEAQEERARYIVLRDIGVSRIEVRQTVARQMAVVFGLPLLVGVCHSTAALIALRNLLGMNILPYCALVVAVYVALYSIYYIFTVRGYVSTVT
ncbi:MAG: hypothetical protein WAW16_04955, partial [Candidatus Cryosericum sp.]